MAALDDLSRRMAVETIAEKSMAVEAAKAEAAYKSARAQAVLSARAAGAKSAAEAEAIADGDDDIAAMLLARLTSRAVADSQKEMLRTLREQSQNERTIRADLRAGDALHSQGFGGAA